MKIERFLHGAIAADGGTISCGVLLENGEVLEIGLDARIPKRKHERLIFLGAGYPTLPGARTLEKGSPEEQEVIAALIDYVRLKVGISKCTSAAAPSCETPPQEPADLMAVTLLKAIQERWAC